MMQMTSFTETVDMYGSRVRELITLTLMVPDVNFQVLSLQTLQKDMIWTSL